VGDGFTPEEREAYYASLFPVRRSCFRAQDCLPNGNPEWHLEALIGAGGFGEVWTARHRFLDDRRAVKFCQDAAGARVLQREAQTLYRLQRDLPPNPHIVALAQGPPVDPGALLAGLFHKGQALISGYHFHRIHLIFANVATNDIAAVESLFLRHLIGVNRPDQAMLTGCRLSLIGVDGALINLPILYFARTLPTRAPSFPPVVARL